MMIQPKEMTVSQMQTVDDEDFPVEEPEDGPEQADTPGEDEA
jgi:hypothetical protein